MRATPLVTATDEILGTHSQEAVTIYRRLAEEPSMWPLRPWITRLHRPFITDFTSFDRPWRLLATHVPDLQVRQLAFTAGYLAVGHTPGVRQMRKPYDKQAKQSLTERTVRKYTRGQPRHWEAGKAVSDCDRVACATPACRGR